MVARKVPETLQCPACHGRCEIVDDVIEYYEVAHDCGYCYGEGKLSRSEFYKVLGYVSAERRRTEKYYRMTHEFYRD